MNHAMAMISGISAVHRREIQGALVNGSLGTIDEVPADTGCLVWGDKAPEPKDTR